MISLRYALPVAIVLAISIVPTVMHSYLGLLTEDGKTSGNIDQVLAGFVSEPTNRKDEWVEEMFASQDWMERAYKNPEGKELRLFVARSYDHKKLYHHPELALSHGVDLGKGDVVNLSNQEGMPVFVFRPKSDAGVVAYALHYEGEYIGDPISHQIGNSLSLLFSGRRPMTIFYISDMTVLPNHTLNDSDIEKLLLAAVDSFYSQSNEAKDNRLENR
jgi:hypothetical protein